MPPVQHRSGTINNNYPSDTGSAGADALRSPDCSKGTDKGFALEKSMTRAGLLGDADPSAWRRKRPRWQETGIIRLPMCRSGRTNTSAGCIRMVLTKGVSATLYGSQRNVTCGQYCIFLARAHLDCGQLSGYGFLSITMRYGRRMRGALSAEMRFRSQRGCSVRTTRKMAMESDRSVAKKLIDDEVFSPRRTVLKCGMGRSARVIQQ